MTYLLLHSSPHITVGAFSHELFLVGFTGSIANNRALLPLHGQQDKRNICLKAQLSLCLYILCHTTLTHIRTECVSHVLMLSWLQRQHKQRRKTTSEGKSLQHNGTHCAAGAPTSRGNFMPFGSIVMIFMPEILLFSRTI